MATNLMKASGTYPKGCDERSTKGKGGAESGINLVFKVGYHPVNGEMLC